ncbi:MAG: hypothetical protein QF662_01000, partial [Phycisphaerae bacterium]|nr:hypothetical protein [Phycisphaerae bacterium]
AQELVKSVHLELDQTHKEDRLRLYQEIEHLVARHRWREAYGTAMTLLARHPESPEATKLQKQLDELKYNAEVQERRETEESITEHLHQGRYRQAYEVASDLIDKYPESPQAEALKGRMEWLRERAQLPQ